MAGARMLGVCLLALTLGAGCQRPGPLLSVTGKVSYKGALLTNVKGVVVFTPDATRGESGPIALGTLREDGTYALNTNDTVGAGPGWYRVTVAAFPNTPPNGLQPMPLLPEKYRDPELSLLRCQIKPNQVNTIDFNLD